MERIINFEGRRIKVPADASDDEVAEILGNSAPAPAAAPQSLSQDVPVPARAMTPSFDAMGNATGGEEPALAAPVPSAPRVPRTAGGGLRFGAQAAGEGLANLIGLPVDAATAVVANPAIFLKNLATGGDTPLIKEPTFGSEFFKNKLVRPVADATGGAVDPESLGAADRMMFEGLSAGTGAVSGGVGMLARGLRRGAEVARQVASGEQILPKALDTATKTYVDAPAAALTRDLTAGFGSGVGLGAAKEIPSEVRDAGGGSVGVGADMAASLLGGAGGLAAQSVGQAGARAAGGAVGSIPGVGRALNLSSIDSTIPINPETLAPMTKRAGDMAAEIYQGSATRPADAAERLQTNRADLAPVLGDRLPSPGSLAEDPGLVALERELAMRDRNPTIIREQNLNAGLRDTVDQIAPNGDPAALQAAAGGEAGRLRSEAQAANAAAIAEREARVGTVEGRTQAVDTIRQNDAAPVAPYQNADAGTNASRRLDAAVVDDTYLPDRAKKNALYDAVDPNRTEMVDIAPMAEAATRVREGANQLGPQGQQLPGEFLQRIERLAPNVEQQPSPILGADGKPVMRDVNTGGSGQAAVGDIVDLQKYTGKARDTARQSGNFDLADNIGDLRAGARAAVEGSPAAAEANANYSENFAPKYRPGPGDEMAKFTRDIDRDNTRSTTPPEKTASRFLLSGEEKSAALRRVLDDSPSGAAGNAAVRDYLLSDLASSGVIDAKSGVIRPDRLRAWRQNYGAQLDAAPGFGAEVDSMIARAGKGERVSDGLAQQIKGAQRKLKETERAAGRSEREVEDRINKGALGSVIDADPDKAVHAIMQSPANAAGKLKELAALTGNNPDARAGLKAAVRDYLVERGSTTAVEKLPAGDSRGPLSPAKVQTLFKEHEAALSTIFAPEEMNAMRVVQKALDLQKTEQVRVRSGSDSVEKSLTSSAFENLLNTPFGRAAEVTARLKFGMLKGGGMIATAKRFLANMTPADSKQALDLLGRAALDPDLAILLASRKIKVGSPEYNNTVQKILAGAAGAREAVSADEE